MALFEKYLSVWVGLCIASGVGLGLVLPSIFEKIATIEYASVNLIVALFIWVMIYPMMVNVDFASIRNVGKRPKGLCITLVVNWIIKPFTMAALGILFFEYIFAGLVDAQTGKEYTEIINQIIKQNKLGDFETVQLTNSVVRQELKL